MGKLDAWLFRRSHSTLTAIGVVTLAFVAATLAEMIPHPSGGGRYRGAPPSSDPFTLVLPLAAGLFVLFKVWPAWRHSQRALTSD